MPQRAVRLKYPAHHRPLLHYNHHSFAILDISISGLKFRGSPDLGLDIGNKITASAGGSGAKTSRLKRQFTATLLSVAVSENGVCSLPLYSLSSREHPAKVIYMKATWTQILGNY